MERCREDNDGKSGRQPFNWSSGVLSMLKKNGCWEQTGAIFGGWPYIRSFDIGPNETRVIISQPLIAMVTDVSSEVG